MSHLILLQKYYQIIRVPYLVPKLHALVSIVREGLAWNKSTSALLSLQFAFLINHPTLTHHQRRTSMALHSLKDVVFRSLCGEGYNTQDKESYK